MKATTVRMEENLLQRVDGIAKSLNLPRSWVLTPAYRMYSLVDLPARISRTGKLLQAAGTASLVAPGELIRSVCPGCQS